VHFSGGGILSDGYPLIEDHLVNLSEITSRLVVKFQLRIFYTTIFNKHQF